MKKLYLSAIAMAFAVSIATAAMAADSADTGGNADIDAYSASGTQAESILANTMTMSGKVKSMDRHNGEMTVTDNAGNDMGFKAPPAMMAGIVEGDMVTVSYQKSGDDNFAMNISKMGGTQQQGGGSKGGTSVPKY